MKVACFSLGKEIDLTVKLVGGLQRLKRDKSVKFSPGLRSTVRRRRVIAERASQLEAQVGSIERATETLELMRDGRAMWSFAEALSKGL